MRQVFLSRTEQFAHFNQPHLSFNIWCRVYFWMKFWAYFFSCSWPFEQWRPLTLNSRKSGKAAGKFQVITFSVQIGPRKRHTLFRLCCRSIPLKICYTTQWIPFFCLKRIPYQLQYNQNHSNRTVNRSLPRHCKALLSANAHWSGKKKRFSIDLNIFAFFSVSRRC